MDDQPPPPPYSPHSPDGTSSQNSIEPAGLAPAYNHSSTIDPSTSILAVHLFPDNHHLPQESNDLSASSLGANPYFVSRPPYRPPPSRIISHRIVLQPDSSLDEIQLPPLFSERGVDEQDWLTFRNHLFPAHGLTGNNQKGDTMYRRDEKWSLDPSNERANDLVNPGPSNSTKGLKDGDPEKDCSRLPNIHKVVKEWNAGFFEPRGLLVIAKTLPQSSSKRKDLDSHSTFGGTILAKAAARGDFKIVEGLLLQGADPDIQPYSSSPAIYDAAANKHPSVVDLLLRHGAKVDTKPSTTHLVASQGDVQTLAILLKYGADPNHKDWTGSSSLFDAAGRGDVLVLKLLLAYGADPNYANTGGHSALYYAIKRRDSTVVQLLLDHGADPNRRPWTGQPCVHLAASQGDVETVRALIAKRADVNATPTMSETALGSAISRGDADMIRLLLENGADVNTKPLGGQSPLFLVASKGDIALLRLLLEKGANVDESPPGFPSALYMAIHREDLETSKVLVEFGANAKTGNSLSVAVDHGNLNAVRLLLDHGADPNSKPTGGQMPLYSAAAKGDTNSMQLLLEKGAKVDWSPIGYSTALYMAVVREDANVVKVLLGYGADVNVTAAGGETVLGHAMKSGSEEIKRLFSAEKGNHYPPEKKG
ncbi:Uncharacterized protein BP5553_10208 [Venustampulla echinocandica]|uniref:Uncharacterized protein n=1 Tax=Venustampulla echinocandica TaxID=2656787 RepID=A0A370T9K2_9HELO|nr:Uncharacterized protein BP5553_10208 [Venustampulla echinocandica]RDL30330.1 Uncharacterized protein BP5553_10208 [Venustampulla echinocandica]